MEKETWLSRIREKREFKKTAKLRKKFEFLIKELKASQDRVVTQVVSQETEILSSRLEKSQNNIIHSIDLLQTDLEEKSAGILEKILSVQREQQVGMSETKEFFDGVLQKLENLDSSNRCIHERDKELVGNCADILEKISLMQREQQVSMNETKEFIDEILHRLENLDSSSCSIRENTKELLECCTVSIGDRLIKCEERIISQISETNSCTKEQIECVHTETMEQNEDIKQILRSIISKIEMVQNNTYQLPEKCTMLAENQSNSILLSIDEVKTLMKIVAVNNLLDEI